MMYAISLPFHLRTLLAGLFLIIASAAPSAVAQTGSPTVALDLVADGLANPLVLKEAPDGTDRLFIADQAGPIWIVEAGNRLGAPFLDLSDRMVNLRANFDERGLLGFAFHPDYAENGRFFVFYSAPLRAQAPDDFNHTSVLAEFTVSADDPDQADPASEQRLLEIDQPYFNHNAGEIAFGPDGMLYLALGDGGNANDADDGTIQGHADDWYAANPGGNGQDLEANLNGSILRLDVSQPGAYAIPDDNPFVDVPGVAGEQWAYGLRNPFRFSFDKGGDHALLVGDVGQELYEEVIRVRKGGNYGWNVREGTTCFNAASVLDPLPSCPTVTGAGHPIEGDTLRPPVLQFKNIDNFPNEGEGNAITGGYVYRGTALPGTFEGTYIFGSYKADGSRGRLLTSDMQPGPDGLWTWQRLTLENQPGGTLDDFLLALGQDLDGEVYVLTSNSPAPNGTSGKVYRLAAPTSTPLTDDHAPLRFSLAQNYPNPFNPETAIRYTVEAPSRVRLTVYDVMGREVARLVDDRVAAGTHTSTWRGRDGAGVLMPSGLFLYRLEVDGRATSRWMVLLK